MRLVLATLGLALLGAACSPLHEDATRVFVRDPHQVWVEVWTSEGERLLLPPGRGLAGITVEADMPPSATVPSFASVFREPSGGITVDHRACAPWAESPLSSKGELTIRRAHGEKGFATEGKNLRVSWKCQDERYTLLELTFVTPLANVREVHVIEEAEERPVAGGSSDPALQSHPWEHAGQ